ncbi:MULTISPECIES: hypothetical protein [Flavobacteriaceae]|uniref:hypothetical protein n=1 Tax=Flavobacteriaceae TaxID=49546 RepID=UPI0010AE9E46|nr:MULTISPECIES: hypothetical protein [Flavobacteriaceae]NJB36772.1 hypothetical protein [Croceivirga sp. JEA036]TKD65411.1 hypothetical protein FBT53_07730 [Flavobacterium sp. ASW18X]
MKKLLVLMLTLGLAIGCDKIDELTKFEMDYEQEVIIPSTTGIDLPFDVFTPETETNSESEFEINDTRKDLIEEIKLIELVLQIENPTDSDFSFLESIEVFIAAEGLEEQRIAFEEEVAPDTGMRLMLNTSDIDLQDYIKKDSFTLRLKTVTDEIINQDHTIKVKSVFFVDAKILGI